MNTAQRGEGETMRAGCKCSAVATVMLCAVATAAVAWTAPLPVLREGTVGFAPSAPRVPSRVLGVAVYDNMGNPANTYYAGQAGNEAIDDLHLVSGGPLESLEFEYYEPDPAAGSFSATVRIYGNPGGADLSSPVLAGPYTVAGLTHGRHAVSLPLPDAPVVDAHAWVGVQFTSRSAGLIINDVPNAGSSHDYYLEDGNFYWFGGSPLANFGLRLTKANVSVGPPGVTPLTLGPCLPNPFRGHTSISFAIARPGPVRLEVLDLSGRRVRTLASGEREAGRHTVEWSGVDVAGRVVGAGVYFVRLESAGEVMTRRIVFAP